MDRRWLSIGVVVAVALLAVSAQPVAALNTGVYKHYTTADDFQSNSQVTQNIEYAGSGDDGYVSIVGDYDDALASHYQLDEGSGDTTTDRVTGTTGQINGASWIDGVADDALSFDGSDDTVDAGQPVTLTNDDTWTISTWIRPTPGGGGGEIVHIGQFQVRLWQPSSSAARIYFNDGQTAQSTGTGAGLDDGEWNHVVGRYDGSELSLWVDGQQVSATAVSTTPAAGREGDITLGGANPSASDPWAGDLDQVQIYERALSPAEISDKSQSPTYRLNDGGYWNLEAQPMPTSGQVHMDVTVENASLDLIVRGADGPNELGEQLTRQTVTSSGNYSIAVDATQYEYLVVGMDGDGNEGDYQLRLNEIVIERENRAPEINEESASPDGTAQSDSTLSINVSDPDLGTGVGESVTVSFYDASDDSLIGTDTVSSNGTASVSWDGVTSGNQEWYAEATDSFSGSDGPTQNYLWPIAGELKIYKETNPDQLISDNNVTLRVRFFDRDAGEVFERTTTNGTIDLSGLPADRRFVVTIDSNATSEFYYRRIILQSVIDTSEIYLLPTSATSAEVEFSLQDYTGGQFPPADTRLYIDSPIRKDFDGDGENETRYRTIFGDTFGSAGEFTAVLQQDERYRLRIINEQGERRILGSYTAARDGVERIAVKGLTFENVDGDGFTTNTTIEKGNLTWKYTDPTASTTNLNVTVRAANGTIVYQDEVTREIENYSVYQVPLDNGTQYDLSWNATRDGQRVGAQQPIGSSSVGIRIPFDSDWLGTLGTLMVVFTLSLAGERKMSYVSMSAVAMAGVLMALQAVDIYPPLWWLGALIAVGAHIRTMQEPGR